MIAYKNVKYPTDEDEIGPKLYTYNFGGEEDKMVQKRKAGNKSKRRCYNNTTNTRGSLGKSFEEGLPRRIEEFQHFSERP